jgi:uncharacterized protein (DUF2132 family)
MVRKASNVLNALCASIRVACRIAKHSRGSSVQYLAYSDWASYECGLLSAKFCHTLYKTFARTELLSDSVGMVSWASEVLFMRSSR